jgi:hypothetical protein
MPKKRQSLADTMRAKGWDVAAMAVSAAKDSMRVSDADIYGPRVFSLPEDSSENAEQS